MVVSWSPFLSESAFVYGALPQNCFLGAADLSALCLQDMKQWLIKRWRCVGVATCAKRTVNLRVLRLLSPPPELPGYYATLLCSCCFLYSTSSYSPGHTVSLLSPGRYWNACSSSIPSTKATSTLFSTVEPFTIGKVGEKKCSDV